MKSRSSRHTNETNCASGLKKQSHNARSNYRIDYQIMIRFSECLIGYLEQISITALFSLYENGLPEHFPYQSHCF